MKFIIGKTLKYKNGEDLKGKLIEYYGAGIPPHHNIHNGHVLIFQK